MSGGGKTANPFAGMADAYREGAAMQAESIDKAMQVYMQQAQASLAEIQRQYNTAREDMRPYREMGISATNALYDLMGLVPPKEVLIANARQEIQQKIQELQSEFNLYASLHNDYGEKGENVFNPRTSIITGPGQDAEYDNYLNKMKGLTDLQAILNTPPNQNVKKTSGPKTFMGQALPSFGKPKGGDGPNVGDDPLAYIANNPELMEQWKASGLSTRFVGGGPLYDEATQDKVFQTITNNPDYQFRFKQGQSALQNSAAAQGSLSSGSTLKALSEYGQGQAADAYNAQVNRLLGLMQGGQDAAAFSAQQAVQKGSDTAAVRSHMADNIGSGIMSKGSVLANARIGSERWDILARAQDQQNKNSSFGQALGGIQGIFGMMGGGMGMQKGGIMTPENTTLVGEITPKKKPPPKKSTKVITTYKGL